LFGAERAFEGDLVRWKWLGVGAGKGDHGGKENNTFAFCSPSDFCGYGVRAGDG
jgi:hypothetical protein